MDQSYNGDFEAHDRRMCTDQGFKTIELLKTGAVIKTKKRTPNVIGKLYSQQTWPISFLTIAIVYWALASHNLPKYVKY